MEDKEAPVCKHEGRYELTRCGTFGFVTCLECGHEVPLATPLGAQIRRIQEYEDKIKSLLFK